MKLSSGILRILPVLCFAASVAGHPHRSARQASFLSTLINSLLRPSGDNAVGEDTADLGRLAGYAVETHTVITNDGYVLTIHHIPPNAKQKFNHETARLNSTMSNTVRSESSFVDESYLSSKPNPAKVVFLQHGLMGSSDNWNTNTKEDCLAYLLSDDGYDVWMGNIRGNIYSRKHKNLTLEDPLFWKFSFDEMAKYDLPAMLDYVLEKTGVEKLHYVGHSMGTTVFFALMSSQPEYQQRIASMVALAPVATVTSISSPIKYLAPVVNDLQFFLRFFGNDEELMTNPLLISLWDPYKACSNQALCENLQFMITGFDPSRADQTMVPIILTHNPAGSSTQTLFHFAQGFSSGRFQQFDYGRVENLKIYGQPSPPEYNVAKINVPITLFWANNDWLTSQEDILLLENQLPQLRGSHKVSNPVFSHLDFLWATDAKPLVYEKIFDALKDLVDDSI